MILLATDGWPDQTIGRSLVGTSGAAYSPQTRATGYDGAWQIGRELDLPIAAHVLGNFGIPKQFARLIEQNMIGPRNIFIHMTGMPDSAWRGPAGRHSGAGSRGSLSHGVSAHE